MSRSCFVPPYLLDRLATTSPHRAARWQAQRAHDVGLRARRGTPAPSAPSVRTASPAPAWTVHTARNGSDLPGDVVRRAGEAESGDAAVDEAAYGVTGALALFSEVYDRSSYDGSGAPVTLTVHYQRDYDNAFWDGTQLVFGDGDGDVFGRFTRPVDVLGHELTHAVTEHTAGLLYQGQSGALNESVSDVFAACLKQRLLDQTAAEADWLIGAGIFVAGINARGLRDMAAPGTAYDDPALGRDPQPGHMDDYVDTDDDEGGVHLNSGIPNRAFQLASVAIGGRTWDGAGRIWYSALVGGQVVARTDFAGFAAATVAAAGEHSDAVAGAWRTVGVLGDSGGSTTHPAPTPRRRQVAVRRTGGFAGRTTEGMVDLEADDPVAVEVAGLVPRVDLAALGGGLPKPDMFSYEFDLDGHRVTVPEQHLTAELRRLAELVLGAGGRGGPPSCG